MGIALLIPAVRSAVFRAARARLTVARFQMGGQSGFSDRRADPFQGGHRPTGHPDVIDGEFHEIEHEKRPTHRPSGWTRH
jgi:UPF0716 protein FxsA